MPVYEYRCGACEHEFEEWQKMSDPPIKTCPRCKKKKVEKLISATSFSLKGGGWYKDLYASAKPGAGAGGDDGGGAAAGKGEAAKSESKPEAKPDKTGKAKGGDKKGKGTKAAA